VLALAAGALPAQDVPFRVSARGWDAEQLGNHRAVVVTGQGDAARVVIPWRRRDHHPELKQVLVISAATGQRVLNVRRGPITRERGEIVFQPVPGQGRYFLYYLPFKSGGRSNYPNVSYLARDTTADPAWLARLRSVEVIPPAQVEAIEAVDSLSSFFPMEVIATEAETAEVRRAGAGRGFVLFPEDRLHPIRMPRDLPARWVQRPPGDSLRGVADRGEYFAFQLGFWALRDQEDVAVRFTDLRAPDSAVIPASRLACLHTGGVDWTGRPFTSAVSVAAGAIQPFWCAVDVPGDAQEGVYRGAAVVESRDGSRATVRLVLEVTPRLAVRGGADEPWKQTRLKWLNSTLAQANDVVAPYTPLLVRGDTVRLLGRRLVVGPDGLPAAIATFFTEEMTGYADTPTPVLAHPVEFVVDGAGRGTAAGIRFTRREPGTVTWTATTTAPDWTLRVDGALEFDGYLSYRMALVARRTLTLNDVRMVIPFAPAASKYLMGLGQKGGRRPASLDWHWDVATKNQDGAWIGDVNAGLFYSLRADNYVRPLNTNFYLQKPLNLPTSWGNGGRGGIAIREAPEAVEVSNYTGPRTLAAGDTLWFDVVALITPFHPLDTDFQWGHRFYHRYSPVDTVVARGANVVNIHHANAINPWINYPFIAWPAMKAYVDSAHARGLQVKIYNTVRELSNRAWEVFPLRSLGHEVFTPGKGGGSAWMQEHLVDDYIAGWYVPDLKDAAIINSGMSRWHNYYIEGINWLVGNVGIDGLYLDDVAFDRVTMKRLKRVLTQDGHPGILDLHSANQYNRNDGFINSAVLYLEHFPYLDRLWFGEYFDYEKNSPDFFLTEVSGIPFGLMGEMLQNGGNPWRGMLYGMTNRLPWSDNADPSALWQLWDRFGMRGSRMIGYWVSRSPVRTGRDDVPATVYAKPGQALVSLASWADSAVTVRLQVDWKALGIDSARATITAPEVRNFQPARTFGPGEEIPVAPGKGWLLVVK
jgi:hypothetical protein